MTDIAVENLIELARNINETIDCIHNDFRELNHCISKLAPDQKAQFYGQLHEHPGGNLTIKVGTIPHPFG